ncbi:MAG: hypothetical protein H3C62_16185, partial [Gemmatimonadaceae bacterium]|nr:hypothetical protein [Gemmatimonadaceae bacterium]
MPPRHPRSLKTLHTRISALAVVLLVVAVTAGSALLYDTYRRVETAQAERVSFWLRSMLAEQGREARSTAEGRASGETGLRLLQQPNDLRLRHRFEGEHVTVLQRRGYAVLLLLDARTRPVFAWTLNGTPLPKEPLPDSLFAALDTTGTMGGFVRWGPDVYRIGAASLGEPGEAAHGYVIVGAPLTSAYLEQLHQAIALPMHMTLTSPSDAAPMQLAAADSFVVLEPLTDLLDRRIATVRAPVDRSSELRRLTWSFAILALVLVAGAGVAWSVWYYGRRLLLEPLDHMVRDV